MKYPSRIQWVVIWGTALVALWMWVSEETGGLARRVGQPHDRRVVALIVIGALVVWMLSDTKKLRGVLDLDGVLRRAGQWWNQFGARRIWTTAAVVFFSGLFLLDLQDLNHPSVAAQDAAIGEKEAQRRRSCEWALKVQAAEARRRAEAAEREARMKWAQVFPNVPYPYTSRAPSASRLPLPEACRPPLTPEQATPVRENAQRRLAIYLVLAMVAAGTLGLWQSIATARR